MNLDGCRFLRTWGLKPEKMLTSGMLNLLFGSIFVLVVILLVMLVLHASAAMAAFACRLAYGGNSHDCFAPATSRLAKSFSWALRLLMTRLQVVL